MDTKGVNKMETWGGTQIVLNKIEGQGGKKKDSTSEKYIENLS